MRRLDTALRGLLCTALTLCSLTALPDGNAQQITPQGGATVAGGFATTATNIVIPQSRAYAVTAGAQQVQISGVTADVSIVQQVATTTLDVELANPGNRQQEAEMLVPVPEGAAVRSFTFAGAAKEPTAKLLPKAEAKTIYKSIVSKLRDPALLEFAGYNLVRSSVFPVPAGGTQRVRLVYEHVLAADDKRVDYVLPRSESFESATPWKITVRVQSKTAISTVYSPSHQIATERVGAGAFKIEVANVPKVEPGHFRLSYLVEGAGLSASLLAYPDPSVGGGYFLLLAGVPAVAPSERAAPAIKREVTIVIDRSGSMAGEKMEQARAAALQVLEGLNEGEAFNIIDYHDNVQKFAPRPVIKDAATTGAARDYVKSLKVAGSTNIHDALVEALRQPATGGMLPLIIFLTDGQPTAGEVREKAIREAVVAANQHKRRIFSFGVGFDVNAPLLTSIANQTRAASTFVLPKENVELKVAQVFRRLGGPALADPQLAMFDAAGQPTTRAVREMLPAEIPDVFEGDQLVLLGQYQGDDPLHFRISGNYFGTPRAFDIKFDLKNATTRNSFVPRLWASRKIAHLVEQISEAGADSAAMNLGRGGIGPSRVTHGTTAGGGAGTSSAAATTGALDPKLKELVDEIVRLSTEFGVLTEYTAFLATEGTDFSARDKLNEQAQASLVRNAQNTRSGMGGVSQAVNSNAQRAQVSANRSNNFFTQSMERVEFTNVQQVTDRTFFRRGGRWVDARALAVEKTAKPDAVVEFGTPAFDRLVERLVAEGRQGILALSGEMLLMVDGKTILVKSPAK